MAELNLYGNSKEPEFPFDLVRGKLDWVRELLAKAKNDWDEQEKFPHRLNIILVFSRARTSTLVAHSFLSEYKQLINRLNELLKSVGAEHHLLTVVRRGNGGYMAPGFITCKRSPRFIWRSRPSHRDVGRNLDYLAAGHCSRKARDEIGTARVIEIQTGAIIITEIVLLKYLQHPNAKKRFNEFNDAKVRTMNEAFERLELPYRFLWEFDTVEKQDSIRQVLSQQIPPDENWWKTNIRWVNQIHYPIGAIAIYPISSFSLDCDYRQYWPIISTVYCLGVKYKGSPADNSYDLHSLTIPLYNIFIEVDNIVNHNKTLDDPKVYAENLANRVEGIVATFKMIDRGRVAAPKYKTPLLNQLCDSILLSRIRSLVKVLKEGRMCHARKRLRTFIWEELEAPKVQADISTIGALPRLNLRQVVRC